MDVYLWFLHWSKDFLVNNIIREIVLRIHRSILAVALLSAFSSQAWSQSLACDKSYAFQATINGVTGGTVCDSSAEAVGDLTSHIFGGNSISYGTSLGYTNISPASAQIRFSNVDLFISFAAGSTTLNLSIPALGITRSFAGATRDDALTQSTTWAQDSNLLSAVMRYQALNSSTSPITGAGGLIPTMASSDFGSSFDTASKIGTADTGESNNLVGINPSYTSYKVNGSSDRVSTFSLPLSYTVRNDIDPRRQLVLSMPITQVSIGNAKSYQAGLGIAYRLPVSDNWTITPGVRYAVVASADRATVSTVMSGSVMSTYVIPLANMDMAIGNMLGYYRTGKFKTDNYSFEPDIKQVMMRNGVMLSQPISIKGSKMALEYSFIDTRYLGSDKPFLDNTQEIGITIGTNRSVASARTYFRGGVTYLRGKDTNGFSLNIGYWF